jgi:hypothetical protein
MTRYYKEYDEHLVALDCIIFGFDEGELKLLLLKRKFGRSCMPDTQSTNWTDKYLHEAVKRFW